MTDKPPEFFEGTEMPNAGWWEALWPDPAGVLAKVGIRPGMDVIDLCSGDGWFTLADRAAGASRRRDRHRAGVARSRPPSADRKHMSNCDFVAGDAYDIARLWPRPG